LKYAHLKLTFRKREDGVQPSRTRRCDRERNLQKPLFDFKWEGAGSRIIRKPEDLAENASSTLRGLRGCGFWKTPFLRDGVFLCPVSSIRAKDTLLHSAEVTPQTVLNFLNGRAAINVLASHYQTEVVVVDMGVNYDFGDGDF
jgi:hypothetical protein